MDVLWNVLCRAGTSNVRSATGPTSEVTPVEIASSVTIASLKNNLVSNKEDPQNERIMIYPVLNILREMP